MADLHHFTVAGGANATSKNALGKSHFLGELLRLAAFYTSVPITDWYECTFDRRKSKQAMRDYKKVQIQLENLETSVRDRCKKEFTGIIQHLLLTNFNNNNKKIISVKCKN